ncbi:MAG: hypothetical protein KF686_03275 [Ramlibacter sp.]|nr:hypothetical protein [Ramlibacter sp.]
MKKSLLSLVMCVAVAACVGAVQAFRDVRDDMVAGLGHAWRRIKDVATNVGRWLLEGMPAPLAKVLPGPARALVAARAYVLRQIKRERPQIAAQWRMCPTT